MSSKSKPQAPPKARKLIRWWILGFGLLILLSIAGTIISWQRTKKSIETELARIRAAGEPVTWEDLDRMRQINPSEQDATQLWLDAFEAIEKAFAGIDKTFAFDKLPFEGEAPHPPPPGKPWPDREIAEDYLAKHAEALRLLQEATKMGGAAKYPGIRDVMDPKYEMSPVSGIRKFARLLQLQANVRAHRGNAQEAMEAIHAIFAVGRSLRNESNLIGLLVFISIESLAMAEIERLMSSVDFEEDDLRKLQNVLRSADYSKWLHSAMLGERVFGISAYRSIQKEIGSAGIENFAWGLGYWILWSDADLAHYLEKMRTMIVATKQPWPEALKRAKNLAPRNSFDPLNPPRNPILKFIPKPFSLSNMFWSSFDSGFRATARGVAHSRTVDAGVAAELYRRRNGKYPEKLERLVPDFLPEVPKDPFDGAPLRYSKEQNGFVVYSVGENGKDNGGDANKMKDVVFRIDRSVKE